MEKNQSQADIIKKYLNPILSRLRFIGVCCLLAVSAGFIVYLLQPQLYESSAVIMYQQWKNPTGLSEEDRTSMREMVNTLSRQVLSRESLEEMIEELELYPGKRQEAPIEDIIEQARQEDIEVEIMKKEANAFRVSYRGREPFTVMQATNWLTSKFIEKNLEYREQRAQSTASYIQDELEMAKKRLNEQEEKMRDYKQKHYNEMPQQRDANMRRLKALEDQYQALQRDINNLSHTRVLLNDQLEAQLQIQDMGEGSEDSEAEGGNSLAAARSRLQDLLTSYTSEHPEVKRQKKRIEQLEEARQGQSSQASGNSNPAPSGSQNNRVQQLSAQLKEIEVSLEDKRKEAEEIREKTDKYEEWIEAAPAREAEWSALTRDYDELKEYHDKLLSRSLIANASESLEARQQASQFNIVDSPYLPNTPLKGTVFKILLASLGIGLAAGCVAAMGLDFLNTSFKDAKEIEEVIGIPVTSALPLIATEKEQKREKMINILWFLFFAAWAAALAGAVFYFWQQGDVILL